MILTELQKLEQEIKTEQWRAGPNQKLWGGADIIVSDERTAESSIQNESVLL